MLTEGRLWGHGGGERPLKLDPADTLILASSLQNREG